MRDRYRRYTAWFLVIVGIALSVAANIFQFLTYSINPDTGSWYESVISTIPTILILVVGGLIASKLAGNIYGWIWILLGIGISVQGLAQAWVGYILAKEINTIPVLTAGQLLSSIGWMVTLSCIAFALLLFPTGRPVSHRWIYAVWLVIAGLFAGLGFAWALPGRSAFLPIENPLGVEGFFAGLAFLAANVAFFSFFISILLGGISLVIRFKRSSGVERLKIKWFALAGVIFVADITASFWLSSFWNSFFYAISLSLLPLAIGIAILRHRLWEIDVIIRSTLVYGGLSVTLGLTYFGSVVLLEGLLKGVFTESNQFSIVVSTLLIAVLFSPLRKRIQNNIDRRFYRKRYNAEHTLQAFAATLRGEVNLEEISDHLPSVVQETIQPAHISLWLREADRQPRARRLEGNPSQTAVERFTVETLEH